jgi:hypothetical protein
MGWAVGRLEAAYLDLILSLPVNAPLISPALPRHDHREREEDRTKLA